MRLLVDGMNVIGTRADGYGATATRLWRASSTDSSAGRPRAATTSPVVFERKPRAADQVSLVEIAHAPKPGPNAADNEIVRRVREDPTRARSASSRPITSSATSAASAPPWSRRARFAIGSSA